MDQAMRPQMMGARVSRVEDPRLLSGQARYLDDVDVPGMLEVAFVRSPHAAAEIVAMRLDKARQHPGVFAVMTYDDCPVMLWDRAEYDIGQPCLAHGEVTYVGQAVVAIIAENRYVAEDAAELVEIEYRPRTPVLDMREAILERPRRVHAETSNVFFHEEYATEGFSEAFDRAPHRLSATFRTNRQTAVSLEARGTAAMIDAASGRLTVYASTQSPHRMREDISNLLDIPEQLVRVIVPEVGGGFGMKANCYPEDIVVAKAALAYRKPVKWVSDRTESLLSDVHGRDDIHDVEVAFADDGKIIAIRDHLMADGGAYPAYPFSGAVGETSLAARVLTGPYDIAHLATVIDCTYSNKVPLGAYRGVWGPIASFIQEGLVERVARYLSLDPAQVRRRNMIRPDQFPYRNAAGMPYDEGSYLASLEDALKLIDYDGFRRRQQELRTQGRYLGLGISAFVEPTAMASSEAGSVGYESCTIRIEPSGRVTAALGLGPTGQGHETTMAQILADQLGVRFEDIVVLHGDTDSAPYGGGTGGSRSGPIGGGAALVAGRQMRQRLIKYAAHLLEAGEDDIELGHGEAWVAGVPDRSISIRTIAQTAYTDVKKIPPGLPIGLELTERYLPKRPVSFSNGTHIAEVEVDIQTGIVRVTRYVVVNDCGRLINPTIVEGQIHGGVAQGIGATLFEALHYDRDGQLTTTSLMDYLLPESTDVPRMVIKHIETPSSGEGGIKGMGEGSLIASPAAVANAISDALAPFGAMVDTLPVTPAMIRAMVS
ncbi:MAG: xanthine dehydrogenase [Sulfobacillus acidophilus]|uniref:Xanthine dehydrogenase n=1 Tax=Sulfobacillus acidophilus TaxID=53633 RepID=A0A2T2WP83_9FIRM|nr:MAG: xanthine dehydrogenase [Sulfobacillus acidophilus]